MTPEVFDEGMGFLSATFPSLAMDEHSLLAWRRLLEDLPDEAFSQAVIRLCREERNLYPGSNIVAMIRERANSTDPGIVALAKLEGAMSKAGAYRSVVFDDPLIHLVVSRMGGWVRLCAMEYDEWKFLRRDFEKLYEAAKRGPVPEEEIPTRLAGLLEIGNSANGNGDEALSISYVGNQAKALAWSGEGQRAIGKGGRDDSPTVAGGSLDRRFLLSRRVEDGAEHRKGSTLKKGGE